MKNSKVQICNKCVVEKEMHIGMKRNRNYYMNICYDCFKIRQMEKSKKYYESNKIKCNQASKDWSSNNKTRKKELNDKRKLKSEQYSITKKLWRENNKDKETQYNINRIKNMTPFQKLKNNMRNSIRLYLERKGFKKESKTEKILGCSFEELKLYLESKFEPWMNWENHGLYNGNFNYGWDIDHIKPLSSGSNDDEITLLCHHTNLQPLCSKVNRHIKRDINPQLSQIVPF